MPEFDDNPFVLSARVFSEGVSKDEHRKNYKFYVEFMDSIRLLAQSLTMNGLRLVL
jgi:hypothetical protein